ncbi:uncharacterized protein YrrD [Caldicoprobacter guelmensis]|uniref:PRC-barrel domain-containing protein n=1 Tax=Caldicoprobacter guelmensis TaxID=1170224 RepID=UPI001959F3C3|nr:PRC-barrel domain-containing protein [Caldicoprobacter guelmensis]MBM7582362.1 uncharacterized protein YrrD [Caldicoprobacter guelmensis]
MKARQDVKGLPVICIREGIECGKVRELLVNCHEGKVRYIIIEDEEWYLGAKLLPLDRVVGIGRHAIVTESRENILPFSLVKEAQDLIRQGIGFINCRVYTQEGEYIGVVKEYYFNEEDGNIVKCKLSGEDGGSFELDASQVITYGTELLVVSDNVSRVIVHEGRDYQAAAPAEDAKKDVEHHMEGSSLFEQKQRRFLLGKRVTKKIVSEAGELLAAEGDIVTGELIDKVKAGGKLVELTMNIEAV